MKILANENIPRSLVECLREHDHDVRWIVAESPGIEDRAVIAEAKRDGRIVLTMDKDYGDLAIRSNVASLGIVLVRFTLDDAGVSRVVEVLDSTHPWRGHFAVIDQSTIRIRPLRKR